MWPCQHVQLFDPPKYSNLMFKWKYTATESTSYTAKYDSIESQKALSYVWAAIALSSNFFRGKKFAGFLVGVLCYKWGGTVSPAKNYDWSTTLCSCGFTCGVWHCLVVWLQKTMIGASQQEVANISKGAPLLPGQLRCQERWDQGQFYTTCLNIIFVGIRLGWTF